MKDAVLHGLCENRKNKSKNASNGAEMKRTLLITGFSSLVFAAGLFALGHSNHSFLVSGIQVQIFPAAFFALMGLLLLFRAVMPTLITPEN